MNVQKIVLLLMVFSLTGCNCGAKKSIPSSRYEAAKETYIVSAQDDFKKKAGGDKVYFAFDKVALSKDAKNILKKQAKWLQNNSSVQASIEGHCDEIGTKSYNLALSLRRANAASNFLIAQGIEKNRVTVISYGKEKPEFLEHTKRAHQLNRRSVTTIVTGQAL
jgi:peptidoglycan-associated lipoprotein